MRRLHWLAPIGCLLLLVSCGRPASAQGDPYGGPPPVGADGRGMPAPLVSGDHYWGGRHEYAMPPGVYDPSHPPGEAPPPTYTAVLPPPGAGAGAIDPAAAPPSVYPWPKISPYDHRFSQHYRDEGLWHQEANNRPRQYYAGVSAFFPRFRRPEQDLFGHKAFQDLFIPGTDPTLPPPSGFESPVVIGTSTSDYGGAHIFDRDFKTEGLRGYWGFIEPADNGFEIGGWWASDVTEKFKRGQQIDPSDPNQAITPPAIPVQTSVDPPAGELLRFDRLFEIAYTQENFNASADFIYTPWVDFDWLQIHPLWGVRYTFIKEQMNFHGFAGGPPGFAAFLNTKFQTHLYGPEFGFRGKMGGEAFRIVGGAKFILYVNSENLEMDGDNFGSSAQVNQARFIARETFFRQQEESTHISPAVEGTVHFEANVFPYIPILKKWHPLEHAKLRAGFTYLYIGEVARPATSIVYRGLPLIPELKTDRSAWHIVGWDFGLDWRF